MHKPRRRTRLVNFRITDGELSQVKAASKSVGYRTLSDFARTALLQFSGVPDDTADLKNQIGTLDEKLIRMQSDLQTLLPGDGAPILSGARAALRTLVATFPE